LLVTVAFAVKSGAWVWGIIQFYEQHFSSEKPVDCEIEKTFRNKIIMYIFILKQLEGSFFSNENGKE
jgi:hypothetical protein